MPKVDYPLLYLIISFLKNLTSGLLKVFGVTGVALSTLVSTSS